MATAKISLSLDGALVREARDRAGPRGLSRYINRALEKQLQHDRLANYLGELERQYGPIDPEVMKEVEELWPDPNDDQN